MNYVEKSSFLTTEGKGKKVKSVERKAKQKTKKNILSFVCLHNLSPSANLT